MKNTVRHILTIISDIQRTGLCFLLSLQFWHQMKNTVRHILTIISDIQRTGLCFLLSLQFWHPMKYTVRHNTKILKTDTRTAQKSQITKYRKTPMVVTGHGCFVFTWNFQLRVLYFICETGHFPARKKTITVCRIFTRAKSHSL